MRSYIYAAIVAVVSAEEQEDGFITGAYGFGAPAFYGPHPYGAPLLDHAYGGYAPYGAYGFDDGFYGYGPHPYGYGPYGMDAPYYGRRHSVVYHDKETPKAKKEEKKPEKKTEKKAAKKNEEDDNAYYYRTHHYAYPAYYYGDKDNQGKAKPNKQSPDTRSTATLENCIYIYGNV